MIRFSELYECKFDTLINGISINSKDVKKGDLFLCVSGKTADRHDYIDEAIKNGAVALVTSHDVDTCIPYVIVDNPNDELIYLCNKIYNYPLEKLNIMAVTGTDGKTSVSTIVSTLIGSDKCGYIGTNGCNSKKFSGETHNTTPSADVLFEYLKCLSDVGCDSVCMEASSEAMLYGRLEGFSYSCVGITNISLEHLNSHGTLENYIDCKKKIMNLVKDDGFCVLNRDDFYYDEIRKSCSGNILTYGKGEDNDLQILSCKLYLDKTCIKYVYKNKVYDVVSPLLGEFNAYNLACALLICISQGYNISDLLNNVSDIYVSGRLDLIDAGQDFTVIVDFAHTPNGVLNVLKFVNSLDVNRIITVTGQAGEKDKSKRKYLGENAVLNSDYVIFTSEDPKSEEPMDIINMMLELVRDYDNYEIVIDRASAIRKAIEMAHTNDVVLILGKGNEMTHKIKDKVIPYNDEEEALKCLKDCVNKVAI